MIRDLLNGKIIVSVQAMPEEPFYNEVCITAMMKSVINGGAQGLRVAGARDVKIAKTFGLPVIGLTKPDKLPENWRDVVYITPTIKETNELIEADADIIAFDGTSRPRNGCTLSDIINRIHDAKKYAMADISNLDEGINCALLGADILSTTLSGYTNTSATADEAPDFELLQQLKEKTDLPVILEGRIWSPNDVKKAFEIGACAVVIGSAITRPHLITKRFCEYN
ncbi:MAG: N-acetylmannosamine-6-phosphate 2-epimerase [bacterium]|nr:N-acetylmannosamine-6-phosphate 2-epimerase [bacterium]